MVYYCFHRISTLDGDEIFRSSDLILPSGISFIHSKTMLDFHALVRLVEGNKIQQEENLFTRSGEVGQAMCRCGGEGTFVWRRERGRRDFQHDCNAHSRVTRRNVGRGGGT